MASCATGHEGCPILRGQRRPMRLTLCTVAIAGNTIMPSQQSSITKLDKSTTKSHLIRLKTLSWLDKRKWRIMILRNVSAYPKDQRNEAADLGLLMVEPSDGSPSNTIASCSLARSGYDHSQGRDRDPVPLNYKMKNYVVSEVTY